MKWISLLILMTCCLTGCQSGDNNDPKKDGDMSMVIAWHSEVEEMTDFAPYSDMSLETRTFKSGLELQ